MKSGPNRDSGQGDPPNATGQGEHPSPVRETDQPPEVAYYCDLCGNRMLDLHCKLVCKTCGYRRDCSDP